MQENWLTLFDFFDEQERFILATIIATHGSTYQKSGAMMLINEQGKHVGLLSGGCLEADISLHALDVLQKNKPEVLTYNLMTDDDLLWGLGLGCEGTIDILLQPLTPDNQHLGFAKMRQALLQRKSGVYRQRLIADEVYGRFSTAKSVKTSETACDVHVDHEYIDIFVTPPLSVLICGAGPDAIPLAEIMTKLGWLVTVWDHRQVHLQQISQIENVNTRKIRPETIEKNELSFFDTAIVMTHNLNADGHYLTQLAESTVRYIGLLGPAARRDKLLSQYNIANSISGRLHAPIGLNLGGRGPQAIALATIAQIQQYFQKTNTANHAQSSAG